MPIRKATASIVLISAFVSLTNAPARADSVNAGEYDYSAARPFVSTVVAEFDTPWAIAFLPDGRLIVTEKSGRMFVASVTGEKTEVTGVPAVSAAGQNGLLDVAISPSFARDGSIYFTFMEPGDGGSGLALARAQLALSGTTARLQDLTVIWRQTPKGGGGSREA